MSYKIVVDSCGELTDAMKRDGHFYSVALELDIDDYHVVDDEHFNQAEFLRKARESRNCPKSSCPSPQSYVDVYKGEQERIYAVTLSDKLSGSYNSAELAAKLCLEECPEKKIYVFNSRSASVGETLIALKVQELEEAGKSFEEIVKETEAYIEAQQTYFVLETLETLRKNGRLSNLKAWVAGALNIKPVMGSTPEGSICQMGQARGMMKALSYMVEEIVKRTKNCEQKILAISHCNCPDRALWVKERIQQILHFKDIIIVDTAGVSTMYANDGGIIVVA